MIIILFCPYPLSFMLQLQIRMKLTVLRLLLKRILLLIQITMPTSPGTNELPIRPKILKIRPMGYFFKLRSILMLPGLEIPLKSEKITKNRIYKRPGFQKMMKYWFELMSLYQFFTQNPNFKPKSTQNQPKTRFWPNFQKIRFWTGTGLNRNS